MNSIQYNTVMNSSANLELAPHRVFVYGSLLVDDVVHALLNRVPPSSAAILNDLFSIKGRVYPAILPVQNNHVTGRVLFGITDSELDILDIFEDVEYQRTTVDVSLMDDSQKLQAYTYVWGDTNDPNLFGEWDFEEHVNCCIYVLRVVDPELPSNYVDTEVEQLIQVALLCTQSSLMERPKMSEVVRMLEGDGLAER